MACPSNRARRIYGGAAGPCRLVAGEIEEIVDEARFQLDVAADHPQPSSISGGTEGSFTIPAGPNQDRRERCAQLVAERGEETVLAAFADSAGFFLEFQFRVQLAAMNERPIWLPSASAKDNKSSSGWTISGTEELKHP